MGKRDDENFGFDSSDFEDSQAVVADVAAGPGCGKTEFGLSGPDPIYFLSVDPNNKRVVQAARKRDGKTVHFRNFIRPARKVLLRSSGGGHAVESDDEAREAADVQFGAFQDAYGAVIADKVEPTPRLIVVDTLSEIREIQLIAHFGKTEQIARHLWTGPNRQLAEIVGAAREAQERGISTVFLSRIKPKRENKVLTNARGDEEEVSYELPGEWEREGIKKMDFLVDVAVMIFKDDEPYKPQDDDDERTTMARRLRMKVTKCTARPTLEGKVYRGVTDSGLAKVSFPFLMKQVFPKSKWRDWR